MESLKGSKLVLVRTFLYKRLAFNIGPIEIPYVILNVMFILPILLNNLLLFYTIYLMLMNDGGFKEISGLIYLLLGDFSAVFIYSSYAHNSYEIIMLMELIESVVANRKFYC